MGLQGLETTDAGNFIIVFRVDVLRISFELTKSIHTKNNMYYLSLISLLLYTKWILKIMTFHFAEIALCSNTKRCDICRVLINAGVRRPSYKLARLWLLC